MIAELSPCCVISLAGPERQRRRPCRQAVRLRTEVARFNCSVGDSSGQQLPSMLHGPCAMHMVACKVEEACQHTGRVPNYGAFCHMFPHGPSMFDVDIDDLYDMHMR